MSMAITLALFGASSRKDTALKEAFIAYLNSLRVGDSAITIWHIAIILPGEPVSDQMIQHLEEADIILLLVTPDLLAPDTLESSEMHVILRRYKAGEVRVIPILLRITPGWEKTSFGALKALPSNEFVQKDQQYKPVSRWSQRELAFANIVEGVRRVIIFLRETNTQRRSYRRLVWEPDPIHSDTIRRVSMVQDLYAQLLRSDATALALTGISGVGKSTLARLLYDYTEEQRLAGNGPYRAKALWLTLDAATTMDDIAGTLFEALHQPSPYISHLQRPIQPQELATQLFNALNDVDRPRLVVLDQFEHLLDAQGRTRLSGLAEWLRLLSTRSCRCRLLFTSRVWPSHVHDTSPLYLQEILTNGLEIAEGIALLQHSSQLIASPQALATIVQRWQGHPKALSLLAMLLPRQQKSLDAFLSDGMPAAGEESPFSFLDYLYAHQLDETQQRLLFAFAIFREPISLYAAQSLIMEAHPESMARFQAALDELLVSRLLEARQGHYRPHALIAEYALTHLVDEDKQTLKETLNQAHTRAAVHYQQQFALISSPSQGWRRLGDVHDLIEAVWHLCQGEQQCQGYELITREHLFVDLQRLGSNMTLLELYRLLFPLESWQPAPAQAGRIHAELGNIYHHLGLKEEARHELERAMELFQSVDDWSGLVFTLNTLGEVYRALTTPTRAIACYEQALTYCKQIPGDEGTRLRGVALNNLGSAYHELKQWEKARSYYEQALSSHLETNEAAITRNNLGQLYEKLKHSEKALQAYIQALQGFQKEGNRRGEATTLMNLGSYWKKCGEIEQVRSYYRESRRIFQEIGDRWGEVSVLRNLAHFYHRRQENYRDALACLLLAAKLLEELHSPQNQEIEGLLALLRYEVGQDTFETLMTEVRPWATQIVEEALGREAYE